MAQVIWCESRVTLLMTTREQESPHPLQPAQELHSMVEELRVPQLDLEPAVEILRWEKFFALGSGAG